MTVIRPAHHQPQSYGWCTWTREWFWRDLIMLSVLDCDRNTWLKSIFFYDRAYIVAACHYNYMLCLLTICKQWETSPRWLQTFIRHIRMASIPFTQSEGRCNVVWTDMAYENQTFYWNQSTIYSYGEILASAPKANSSLINKLIKVMAHLNPDEHKHSLDSNS